MPQISVIVPVYKVEPYLRRCVDSILAQTFADFELILVDDGSPDNCGAICDEYAQKDSRVRVVHKENGGLSSARNAGLDMAVGSYILFADSDDYVSPLWCESFVAQIMEGELRYIFGGIQNVRIHLGEITETMISCPCEQEEQFELADFFQLQSKGLIGYACNVLYNHNIIRKYHLRFSSEVIIEDLPFCLAYLKYMDCLYYTGEAGYFYVHDDRVTLSSKYYADSFRKWREKYAASQAFIEECISAERQEQVRHTVASSYLYRFLNSLNQTFDSRNEKSFSQKYCYNRDVVCSAEFQHCLRYADTSGENKRYIDALKKKMYNQAYIIQLCAQIKRKIRGGH